MRVLHRTARSSRSASGPEGLTPQARFNFLSDKAGDVYQALAGGRGVFRLTRDEVTALKQAAAPAAA